MYVCMHTCMYVCMYVCMYICFSLTKTLKFMYVRTNIHDVCRLSTAMVSTGELPRGCGEKERITECIAEASQGCHTGLSY